MHPIHRVWPKTHVCCVFGVSVFDGRTVRNSPGMSVLLTFGTKNLQLDFPQQTHPIHPVWPKTHVCCVFGVSVFDGKMVVKSPGRSIIATFGTKKLAVEFSATNAPNPPRLTQNSCLLHFRTFGFRRKNAAKLTEEDRYSDFRNQKTWSSIFCNERTQCTPFDPKLMFVAFSELRFSMVQRRKTRPGEPS